MFEIITLMQNRHTQVSFRQDRCECMFSFQLRRSHTYLLKAKINRLEVESGVAAA